MSRTGFNLIDFRSACGSRQFAEIPDLFGTVRWAEMRDRLAKCEGVNVTFFTDVISQAITDFTYRGYEFTVDTQFGELWFFVTNPDCPDELLMEVLALFPQA